MTGIDMVGKGVRVVGWYKQSDKQYQYQSMPISDPWNPPSPKQQIEGS